LFRFWKEHLGLDRSRDVHGGVPSGPVASANPVRILAEVYAKLLGALLMHWLIVASCWDEPERSLVKAARQLRPRLAELARRLTRNYGVCAQLTCMCQTVGRHCAVTKHRQRPSTAQLLLNPSLRGP
jgi:hypothetical protein